uniref:Phosphatidylcholine transfer protein n=1 Tax=Oncorhynchus mykiss TaxID=8022 RepID=A0A8C7NYW8_ONCMY
MFLQLAIIRALGYGISYIVGVVYIWKRELLSYAVHRKLDFMSTKSLECLSPALQNCVLMSTWTCPIGNNGMDMSKYPTELHEKDYDGHSAIYWEVKYPFPLSNRDYVYVRERRDVDVDSRKIWVVLAKSSPQSPLPEKSGVQRVNDYKQTVAMESDGACGAKVFMNYFDNPGGNIPTWLVNWAAKSGVPAFLTDMQKACGNYSNYCQKNKK